MKEYKKKIKMSNLEDMGDFSVTVDKGAVKEAVAALLHTVLFHRTYGEVRPREITCQLLDLTYVRSPIQIDRVCVIRTRRIN